MTSTQFKKAKQVIDFVTQNPLSTFYQDKYRREDLDIKKIKSGEDFKKIPFLTKEEIAASDPLDRLFFPEDKTSCWVRTSGTTEGKPIFIPISRRKQEHLDLLADILLDNSVKKILLLMPIGFTSMRLFEWGIHPKLSFQPVILCDISNLDLASKIVSEIQVDGLQTTPSALYYLIPFLKEVYDFEKIKFIRLAGEFTSEQRFAFFRLYFKKAYFDFDLGAMEAGGNTAFRCNFLNYNYPPRFYHPRSRDFLFEVIDENLSLLNGGSGELVLTSIQKTPFPLIRYRTGDSVCINKFDCPCGRKYLLEIFGRIGYDSIRVAGITLYRHLIEEAIAKALGGALNIDYEAHLFEVIYKNRLVPSLVVYVSGSSIKNPATFARKVEANLKVGSGLYLSSLVKEEVFAPVTVEQVKKFDMGYKKIKIISHLK